MTDTNTEWTYVNNLLGNGILNLIADGLSLKGFEIGRGLSGGDVLGHGGYGCNLVEVKTKPRGVGQPNEFNIVVSIKEDVSPSKPIIEISDRDGDYAITLDVNELTIYKIVEAIEDWPIFEINGE